MRSHPTPFLLADLYLTDELANLGNGLDISTVVM